MMPFFPFFRSPMYYNSYGNPYYSNFQHNSVNNTNHQVNTNNIYGNSNGQAQNISLPKDDIVESSTISSSEQYFDIFGIRLHFDDILIICLLFFLYEEDVTDQLLFIALLLLLLS